MTAKTKENLIVTVCGVTLFAVLFHLSSVLDFLSRVFLLIRPIVVGAILAIFIHVPVNGIEKRLTRLPQGLKKKPSANHNMACGRFFSTMPSCPLPQVSRVMKGFYIVFHKPPIRVSARIHRQLYPHVFQPCLTAFKAVVVSVLLHVYDCHQEHRNIIVAYELRYQLLNMVGR